MMEFLFSPSGRIGRGRYWLAVAVQIAASMVGWIMLGAGQVMSENGSHAGSLLLMLASLAVFLCALWMGLCTLIKRFHDRGKSGWWWLIAFIPIVGSIWIFVECGLLRGDDGSNAYGPPPGSVMGDSASGSSFGSGEFEMGGNGGLAKLDDEYFKQQVRMRDLAAAAPAPAAPSVGGRPAFGRRT
jgi:uncharacterized membrane protein YhaH (DUF805 family)